MNFKQPEKIVKAATIGIVIYLVCFGMAMAFFPIRPFWNDEWRLIYNIKFKSVHQLWGTLDLLQECPRTYLTVLKYISAYFDYSYTALRLPPLVISVASIFLLFHLKRKLFNGANIYSYLFILIFVSSQTFTDYIVQVKHYEIELFLCLLALWQLITLLDICKEGRINRSTYLLLCISFLSAPYFGYTYPIAIAPVFPIILFSSLASVKSRQRKIQFLLSAYFPLAIAAASIIIFYCIDVKHVMADNSMYLSYIRLCYNGIKESFIEEFWKLFALVGSGALYEIIFGVLGLAAFFYGIYRIAMARKRTLQQEDYVRLYAVLLLLIILCLFLTDKLLGGVARLTAFSVPSIALLIVFLLQDLKTRFNLAKPANVILAVLFLGLFGNTISTCINRFTYIEYSNRIKTYRSTGEALKAARLSKVPILFTERVRGNDDGVHGDQMDPPPSTPGHIDSNTITPEQIKGVDLLCAEVILKVNPEYKVWDTVPVYKIPDMKWTSEYMKQLPLKYNAAIASDGLHYSRLDR